MFTKMTLRFYEVDSNTDTTEGRGMQEVRWKGASLQEAKKQWDQTCGIYGTNQGKHIYLKTITQNEDGSLKETRREIYGTEWNAEARRHDLRWKAGFTGNEA